MGTLSKIALLLFLVVGLIASAENPNYNPWANVRATPLPTISGGETKVQLTPEERQKALDRNRDYYSKQDTSTNWDGAPVLQPNGQAQQYDECLAVCARTSRQATCVQDCARTYMSGNALNNQQIYESTGKTGGGWVTNPTNRNPASELNGLPPNGMIESP